MTRTHRLSVRLSRALALLLALPLDLRCETLTLSTTYPSPAGIYNQIITTGNGAKDTLLARDSGRVVVGSSGGGDKLVVNGGTRLVGDARVVGDVNAKGILIDGVRLVWKEIVLSATPPSASYSAWGSVYAGPARADDCDGSPDAVYACPAGLVTRKTCTDVASGGLTAGTEADDYPDAAPIGVSGAIAQDSCGSGGWQEPFTCPAGVSKNCRDTWCTTSKSGSNCYSRDVTCRTPTRGYQDRTVVCDPGAPGSKLRVLTSE